MIEKIMKKKKYYKYFLLILFAIPLLLVNLTAINHYDENILNDISRNTEIAKGRYPLMENELNELKEIYLELDASAINNIELKKKMSSLCSLFIKTGSAKECIVDNISPSLKYINVSSVFIRTSSEQDNLVISELLKEIYNIANVLEEPNLLVLDLYKNITK